MLEKDLTKVIEKAGVPTHIGNVTEYLEWLNPNSTKITTKDFKEAFRYSLLKDLNFPSNLVFFAHKPKFVEADTYITYLILNEIRSDYASDEAKSITWKIQVNIYSKDDYDDLKERVISQLEKYGLVCYDTQEFYLDDLEMYHVPMRFNYKMLK